MLVLHEFHLLDGRGGGPAAEDDRGAAAVDDVPRARRLRAARAGHDRLALRAHRLPRRSRRRRDGRPAARPRACPPTSSTATVAAAGGDLARARILAADPDLVERRAGVRRPCRRASTAPARPWSATVDELLALIEAAAAPLAARHAAEVAELDARIEQLRRARQRPQGARGAPQARAAPPPHRRAAQRARRAGRRLPRPLVAGASHHPEAVVDAVAPHPRRDRGARAQPERAVAAAIAAVVAARHVTAGRLVARRGSGRRCRARRGRSRRGRCRRPAPPTP